MSAGSLNNLLGGRGQQVRRFGKLTQRDIADVLDVSISSVNRWKRDHPDYVGRRIQWLLNAAEQSPLLVGTQPWLLLPHPFTEDSKALDLSLKDGHLHYRSTETPGCIQASIICPDSLAYPAQVYIRSHFRFKHHWADNFLLSPEETTYPGTTGRSTLLVEPVRDWSYQLQYNFYLLCQQPEAAL